MTSTTGATGALVIVKLPFTFCNTRMIPLLIAAASEFLLINFFYEGLAAF
jgi:hypothetical protein